MTKTNLVCGTFLATLAVFSVNSQATGIDGAGIDGSNAPCTKTKIPIMVYGTVDPDGRRVVEGSGGWQSSRKNKGEYEITIDKDIFQAPPVCLATGTDNQRNSHTNDNVITTYDVQTTGFKVESFDVAGGDRYENGGFSFLCLLKPDSSKARTK